ncbi:hypothetical protein JCGZ_00614 [Jatropha curcas]|uniref:Uncharacterized protein n=1 Tax=Jatropha curcas TaxID=180498 RepID=A0A067JDC8_JATCU|nr:cyclin-dependent protein kinase inhibitor SMR11 [Jatropha curcas]KDP21827.1 hypothetical protein JCGZ_00614 [Jatropha curcas]
MGIMDSESCVNQMRKCQDLSQKSTEISDEISGEEANNGKVELSLGPITPDVNKENGDFPLDLSSPLTVLKKLSKVLTFDSKTDLNQDPLASIDDSSSPRTPKDGVFDPFAPGPDDKAMAPLCKKYSDEARISVARRLNFGSSIKDLSFISPGDEAKSISDEEMFKSVYENLLEVIVYNQTETALAELSNMDMEWDSEACTTPPSAPRISGVAETCPGAPLKSTGKSRIIDLGLCKKLEF